MTMTSSHLRNSFFNKNKQQTGFQYSLKYNNLPRVKRPTNLVFTK